MAVSLRRIRRLLLAALVALALLAAHDAWRLQQREALNALITDGRLPADDDPRRVPELRFAQAAALAASGATEAAVQRYGALQADTPLGRAARYNAANLLMSQAMELHANARRGQALALVELAKESYREVLRQDPQDWAARYNLERAQRLVPDPEEVDEAPPDSRRDAERAATTMRGFAPGLP